MKNDYYSKVLSANKLKRCYDIASPRIQQYLKAEIQYCLKFIKPSSKVLELGCGYGRVMKELAPKAKSVYGIDTSTESLILAKQYLQEFNNVKLLEMNAKSMHFNDGEFDIVIAIQNAISAFKIEPEILVNESVRITKPEGKVILSSYSENIWKERLDWFIEQADEGLLGEIDIDNSKNGTIIGKDGFMATTYTKKDFVSLMKKLNLIAEISEIDYSSIFCVINVI